MIFAEPNYILKNDFPESEYQDPDSDVILSEPEDPDVPDMTKSQYAYGNGPGGMDVPYWNEPDNTNIKKDKDMVVAVIDTGVDYTHEDLNMWDEGLFKKRF